MGTAQAWVGVVLIAVATVGGAAVAGSGAAGGSAHRRGLCFGAASGALLVIAGVHLLPDAWTGARSAGLPVALVPLVSLAAYALTGWLTRRGCTCAADREAGGGIGTTAALAGHRVLEGAALAVTGSLTVLAALATHAVAEGLAAGALLASAPRRRRLGWLAALCVSPAAGVALTDAGLPARLTPVLLAAAVGVLAQAARIGLAAAFSSRRVSLAPPAAAMLAAGLVTALAVVRLG